MKTQFGPAYNVFIPYTRDGHHKTECALRVRLADEEMPTIFSDMSYVKLEGADTDRDDSAKSVAGTKTDSSSEKTDTAKSIGQISRKDGVMTTSANRPPSKPQLTETKQKSHRRLPPEIEARLAALQKKKPVKLRDKSKIADARSDGAEDSGPPDFEAGPGGLGQTRGPRRFAAPAAVSPITREAQPLSGAASGTLRESEIQNRRRHSLAPAHQLEKSSASVTPLHNTQAASAVFSGGMATPFDQTIRKAETFAVAQNWTEAIRLVSQVDREVRSKHVSWPIDRPTPSTLVATWEMQRIALAASGAQAERAARVDSRINDYLKASKTQLEKNQPTEARRLAAVAHLISRVALKSTDTKKPSAESRDGAMSIPTRETPVGPPTKKTPEVSLSGWDKTMQPEKSVPPVHPLAGTGGDE